MPIKDPLGDRMKEYEDVNRHYLTPKIPVILRCDGKAFHGLTKGLEKPYDTSFMEFMNGVAINLCEYIQGCKFGYVQSDEISLVLMDTDKEDTEGWFGYNVQKMCSVAAAKAAIEFQRQIQPYIESNPTAAKIKDREALFDCRVFNIPEHEIENYFIWRQNDATRNSIQMLAQANFSHKELQGLTSNELQEKLWQERGINWNNEPTRFKRGAGIIKTPRIQTNKLIEYKDKKTGVLISKEVNVERQIWNIDQNIPIFTQDRNYIRRCIANATRQAEVKA